MNPVIRSLTADESRALSAARLVAVEMAPYLAHAIFAMRPLAAEGLETFAVDRHWRLYVDPVTMDEFGPQVSGAVLVHEVNHLIRDHAGRAKDLGAQVDHERWNIATDAAINDDLISAGMPLPEWVVTPEKLGLDSNGIEESYYGALPAQAPQQDVGCGSGAGDPTQGWEPSPDSPTAPGLDDGQVTITRRRVAHEIDDAVRQGRGTVPGGLARWANTELAAPSVPWRKVLAGMVRRAAALTTGRITYTYARPGRRHLPGIVTPSMRAPKLTVVAVGDTSGSMTASDLEAALSEVTGIAKAAGGTIRYLACDAEASAARTIRSARDVTMVGGGGTDMRVGIAAAEKLRPAPDVIVVLTDGGTPWPSEPTRANLIIALTRPHTLPSIPAWARGLVVGG